jgi:FkbM family methyltransferase
MVAGGYLFCPHLMLKQIPYDPYIYFIGEEIAHAARFFTHGWVGYTPHKCLIHHFYTRKESIKQWEDDKQTWSTLDAASLERVRHLFGIERTTNPLALAEIEKYGLGSDRSLSEFQTCIGVNFNAQFIHRQRHESLDAIQSSINNPAPPISTFEMSTLGIYACRHGYYLLPKQDAYIGKSLIEYGEWVEGINALFSKIFPTGGVALEVGSGFGAHTIPLARLAGKDGRIFAIEQSRRLTELLHANIALNGLSNVRVTQAHIGSTVGSVKIREPLFTSTSNFGLISHVTDIDSEKYTDQITTLDSIIYDRLDLIFIDTPGMVNEIVTSGIATILKHTPIIIINSDNTEDTKIATELLLKIGFNLQNEYFYFFDKNNYLGNKNNIFNSLVSNVLVARFNR